MRRDMGLVAKIMKYARENADGGNSKCFPDIVCFSHEEVNYHIKLCSQAGYVETERHGRVPGTSKHAFSIVDVTWLGHDYLDSLE